MSIEFFPYAGLSHTARVRNNRLIIRISDLFTDAPENVLQSLALILLAKIYRRPVDESHHSTYRTFILNGDLLQRARAIRRTRGRAPRPAVAQGRWQDLDRIFDRVNGEYFGGRLERPRLTWSTTRSRRILGRYEATYRTVTISLFFDSPHIPDFVIEYLMYHELLHMVHPSRTEACRSIAHTPEFRLDERKFKDYKKAMDWIRKI
jgi:hypothetical protein